MNKKFLSIILTLSLLLSIWAPCVIAQDADGQTPSYAEDFCETAAAIANNIAQGYTSADDYWACMDMGAYSDLYPTSPSRLGDDAKQTLINNVEEKLSNSPTESDTFKAILSLSANGYDPSLVYPVNSNDAIDAFSILNSFTHSTSVWSAPYTLAAYNQGEHSSSEYESALVSALLDSQCDDGSWNEYGTIDTTANAVAGLSFYSDDDAVRSAIENAISYLSSQQNEDGTFSSYGSSNSNSTAMVVIALSAAGVDMINDARFIKNENTVLDGLLSFALPDKSGFGYTDNASLNGSATEQSFRALISAIQCINSNSSYNIYDFSHKELLPARKTGLYNPSENPLTPDGNEITVRVTIKTESVYWLKNYSVTLPKNGVRASHAFVAACDENSIGQVGAEDGYISSITKNGVTLAEFTNGPNSGWLYKVNDISPKVGVTDFELTDGDRLVFYYTNDYTLEPSYYRSPSSGFPSLSQKAEQEKTEDMISDMLEAFPSKNPSPTVSSIGGEWLILALARGNASVPENYFEDYLDNVYKHIIKNKGILHEKKYTEYARVALALSALGQNPQNFGGFDLVAPLLDYDSTVEQGTNGAIYALLALDCKDYNNSDNTEALATARQKYIDFLLNNQNSDGGFGLSSGSASDTDVTAMVLQSLSRYTSNDRVRTAIDSALDFLSKNQCDDGSFKGQFGNTSESSAQILTAMSVLGISITDTRFVKNKKTVLDGLLSFYKKGSGFVHLSSSDEVNQMSTEQAICALVAYIRAKNKLPSFFDMQDSIETKWISGDSFGLPNKISDIMLIPVICPDKGFDDISTEPYKSEIIALAERGIIKGKTNSSFDPSGEVTRAEFSALLTRALGIEATSSYSFEDVAKDSWYYASVSTAYQYGIIKGVSDTHFNPNGIITREEASVMLARCAMLCGQSSISDEQQIRNILAQFDDYTTISDWAQASLALCINAKIFSDASLELEPSKPLLRSESAYLLYNLLDTSLLL